MPEGSNRSSGPKPVSKATWIGLAGLVVVPIIGAKFGLISDFYFFQLSLMVSYGIGVLGLNLLTGFNGQISLGHGAFYAVGAYVAAILMNEFSWPYWATLPAVAVACFAVGYVFGKPALRLEGHYLALATFALALAVPQLLKYPHFEGFTNGVQGIVLEKPQAPAWLPLNEDQWLYYVCLIVAVAMFWLARNMLDSRSGWAMMAIRGHQMAADTMGIDTAKYKTIVFGISAAYTGIAGALGAITIAFVSPDSFRFELSIALLVGLVVGGVGSLPGSIIGGVFVTLIDRYADKFATSLAENLNLPIVIPPWTIYGLVLIILMNFMPGGIAGGLASLRQRLPRLLARRS